MVIEYPPLGLGVRRAEGFAPCFPPGHEVIGGQNVPEQLGRIAFKFAENFRRELVVLSRTAKQSRWRMAAVPRDSGEPRGLRVFFPVLGRLRLGNVVDFTREPFHTQQLVYFVAREFNPLGLGLVLNMRECDQRVLVEVIKGVGFVGTLLGALGRFGIYRPLPVK